MKPNPRSLRLLHSVERCGSLLNTGNNPDENKVEVLIILRISRAMSDPNPSFFSNISPMAGYEAVAGVLDVGTLHLLQRCESWAGNLFLNTNPQ